jgi:hypothetical protein
MRTRERIALRPRGYVSIFLGSARARGYKSLVIRQPVKRSNDQFFNACDIVVIQISHEIYVLLLLRVTLRVCVRSPSTTYLMRYCVVYRGFHARPDGI